MGMDVYANGMAIACKAADGKTIAAFPDVCFTPPQTPATPPGVPIPYPNTAMASDTSNGSKTVQIGGQEVMLKNKSVFKTSTGDEAGCAPKKGVVTSTNKGEANFICWSMDVKFEGENVPRHLDLMGHNEQCDPTNTPPWVYLDKMTMTAPVGHPCKTEIDRAQSACKSSKKKKVGKRMHRICDKEGKCKKAMQCIMVPKGLDKELCCSPDNTGHHLIEDHWVRPDDKLLPAFKHLAGKEKGAYNGAPTVCVNKSRFHDMHGIAHGTQGVHEDDFIGKVFTYSTAKAIALEAHKDAFPKAGCKKKCLESQLDAFYGADGKKQCHTPDRKQPLKPDQRKQAMSRKRKLSVAGN